MDSAVHAWLAQTTPPEPLSPLRGSGATRPHPCRLHDYVAYIEEHAHHCPACLMLLQAFMEWMRPLDLEINPVDH